MKHYDLKDSETELIEEALEYYLHNAKLNYAEEQTINHLILKIQGRGMSFEAIKEIMDKQCLKTLNDDVDETELKEYIQKTFYDKGMGISNVIPTDTIVRNGRKGQVFEFRLFYNEAYNANNGGFCPQDMPYERMVVWAWELAEQEEE